METQLQPWKSENLTWDLYFFAGIADTIMRWFGVFAAKPKLGDHGRPANEADMSLLVLNDNLLQIILKMLDGAAFSKLSRTCKRLNELANNYLSWSCSLMGKRIEKFIYHAYDCKNLRVAKALYDRCCNAELLNLNLEIINERNAKTIWRILGDVGGKLFSLVTTVSVCDTNEIWPFCQVINKEITFELADATSVKVYYISLCDKQSSLNNHTKIKLTIESPRSREVSIIYNSKPTGLLDNGIIQTRMKESGYGDTVNYHETQNTNVFGPVFDLFEKELGLPAHTISFELFTEFLQNISKNPTCGHIYTDVNDLERKSTCLRELILRTRQHRRKLKLEFLRTELNRHHISSTETDFQELSRCLAKLAQSNGKQLKNLRLRAQCIRDIISDMNCASLQHDMHVFLSIIKNIDLDSIKSGWACINTNLFTIWKEFVLTLGKDKHFKATITWQEKRDRVNEYSLSNKEICLVLERKRFTVKLKMSSESTAANGERRGSIKQMKSELKHLISKVRLRKTGLNDINQHYLFIILTTILEE